MVKLVPVPNELPLVGTEYQFKVPAFAVAAKATVPASQRLPGVVEVTVGIAVTVMYPVFVSVSFPLKLAATKLTA